LLSSAKRLFSDQMSSSVAMRYTVIFFGLLPFVGLCLLLMYEL
jgi:hypothetical protein